MQLISPCRSRVLNNRTQFNDLSWQYINESTLPTGVTGDVIIFVSRINYDCNFKVNGTALASVVNKTTTVGGSTTIYERVFITTLNTGDTFSMKGYGFVGYTA